LAFDIEEEDDDFINKDEVGLGRKRLQKEEDSEEEESYERVGKNRKPVNYSSEDDN
jgi:hypothetical protein